MLFTTNTSQGVSYVTRVPSESKKGDRIQRKLHDTSTICTSRTRARMQSSSVSRNVCSLSRLFDSQRTHPSNTDQLQGPKPRFQQRRPTPRTHFDGSIPLFQCSGGTFSDLIVLRPISLSIHEQFERIGQDQRKDRMTSGADKVQTKSSISSQDGQESSGSEFMNIYMYHTYQCDPCAIPYHLFGLYSGSTNDYIVMTCFITRH